MDRSCWCAGRTVPWAAGGGTRTDYGDERRKVSVINTHPMLATRNPLHSPTESARSRSTFGRPPARTHGTSSTETVDYKRLIGSDPSGPCRCSRRPGRRTRPGPPPLASTARGRGGCRCRAHGCARPSRRTDHQPQGAGRSQPARGRQNENGRGIQPRPLFANPASRTVTGAASRLLLLRRRRPPTEPAASPRRARACRPPLRGGTAGYAPPQGWGRRTPFRTSGRC